MCGICGVVSSAETEFGDTILRMCAALTHRGPDGEGSFVSKHIALGMRRLSVIDIEEGWQPFHNEDRSLTLIANGEIYNSDDLRARLLAAGHRFRSHSDCEDSCLPKDLAALIHQSNALGYAMPLLRTVQAVNDLQRLKPLHLVREHLEVQRAARGVIAVLGLSYEPHTDT
jgi:glutamine phosphoribosylpyrophosphate amidotransferase